VTDKWLCAWSSSGMLPTEETGVLGEKHYTASVVDEWMSMEEWWNETDRGNWSTGRKTVELAQSSTTNHTWTELGSNPDFAVTGRRLTASAMARPANILSHILRQLQNLVPFLQLYQVPKTAVICLMVLRFRPLVLMISKPPCLCMWDCRGGLCRKRLKYVGLSDVFFPAIQYDHVVSDMVLLRNGEGGRWRERNDGRKVK
jgi:hypothetical protein